MEEIMLSDIMLSDSVAIINKQKNCYIGHVSVLSEDCVYESSHMGRRINIGKRVCILTTHKKPMFICGFTKDVIRKRIILTEKEYNR